MQDSMNYMFKAGFLGTNAPLFMDMVTLIVAVLPIIVFASVLLARKGKYKLHAFTQNIIFIFSVVVIAYFELGVRIGGGFNTFMAESEVSPTYATIVLLVHIAIAVVTLFFWIRTIVNANYQFSKGTIPGIGSKIHKLLAVKTFIGIIFTSFSGIWVYILLFIS